MSYIPDCRTKYVKDLEFPYKRHTDEQIDKNEINGYWYGLLDGTDREFVRGYDYNTTHVVNNLFDNLEVYATELESIGLDVSKVDTDIVNGVNPYSESSEDTRPYKDLNDFSVEELQQLSEETRLMLFFKSILNDYIEMNRDELVTSMIDNMDDDIHTKNLEKAYNDSK